MKQQIESFLLRYKIYNGLQWHTLTTVPYSFNNCVATLPQVMHTRPVTTNKPTTKSIRLRPQKACIPLNSVCSDRNVYCTYPTTRDLPRT